MSSDPRTYSAPTRADEKTISNDFSPLQKLFVVCVVLAILGGTWFFVSGQAASTVDVTLSANPALEQGLVGHWTFDGKDLTEAVGGDGSTIAHTGSTTGMITASTTVSFSRTTSGSDRLLVVAISARDSISDDRRADTVTYNDVPLALITRADNGAVLADLWYLVNPTTGPNTVAVDMGGGGTTGAAITAISFSGVHPTNALNATSTNSVTSLSVSATTTTTVANTMLVDDVDYDGNNVLSPANGQIATTSTYQSGLKRYGVSYKGPNAGVGDITSGWSSDGVDDWTYVTAAFAPASSASTPGLALDRTAADHDATRTGTTPTRAALLRRYRRRTDL